MLRSEMVNKLNGFQDRLDSLDCCVQNVAINVQEQKQEENNMDMFARQEQEQRDYLERRLEAEQYSKDDEARQVFYMDGDSYPGTWEELLQRIKDGKFVYSEAKAKAQEENLSLYGPFGFVEWRDPNKPADKEGYKAFVKKFHAAHNDARDQIRVLSPAEGLTALETFKALTIQ